MADVSAPPAPSGRSLRAAGGSLPRSTLAAAGVAVLAAAAALALAIDQGGFRPGAGSEVLRAAVAALGTFLLCGYAPARLLSPATLRPHLWLLVFPVGAASSSLALAVLGLLHSPFKLSLALVLAAGAVSAGLVRRRHGPLPLRGEEPGAGGALVRLGWPAFLLALSVAILLIPLFRAQQPTVLGQNGDAVLAIETVDFVQHAPPTARRDDRAVDRVPLVWRSKLPIFYSMGATATLAGLTPFAVFAVQAALVLALAAIGFFLFAFHAIRAGPWAALAVLAAVPLNRMLIYVADHPYYNQTWGLFALPFILTFGVMWLRAPSRRLGGLLALFTAIGAFAYPLMLVFPAAFLALAGAVTWRRREGGAAARWRPRLPADRRRALLLGVPAAVVLVPVVLVLGRGVGEKLASAFTVLLPGHDLTHWGGVVPYFAVHRFFGLPDPRWLGLALLVGMGGLFAWTVWSGPRDVGVPALLVIAAALLFALDFRLRRQGSLFYFRDLNFAATIAVALAVAGLADLIRRGVAARARWWPAPALAGAGLAVAFLLNARVELAQTTDQSNVNVRELAAFSVAIPRSASVRIDVPPSGYQLWAMYYLARHRLSSTRPIGAFYPYPPIGRRADYVLVERPDGEPGDATGPPVRFNAQFALYRLKATLPGPDVSSRRMVEPITKITLG